jgi:hypothetical protein
MKSAGKLFLGAVICSVLTLTLLELSLPLLNNRYSGNFKRTITASTLKSDAARRFFASKTFDPDLGWDYEPVARDHVPGKTYIAQSYGDSFTYGGQEETPGTWQVHFERLTGKSIINLGVGGYGLDQAVHKFEKYGRRYPPRIAILGLYHDMYRRALSYHSFYFFSNHDDFTFVFKPIFIKKDGQFELLRPPCANIPCLMELLSNANHHVWELLKSYDYWYQKNQDKPVPGFPNTIKYAQAVQQVLHLRRELRGEENYFFVNADSLELVKYLIERFVKNSRDMGMTPVCVMLYDSSDLALIKAGTRLDGELLKFLAVKNVPYVDTAQYILQKYTESDRFEGLRSPDGHLNSRGNLMVAESLARGLASIGLLGQE